MLAKDKNKTPEIYSHDVSQMVNPLPCNSTVNLDIDYHWSDSDVKNTPLYRFGKLLRTDSRRKTYNLLDLPKNIKYKYTAKNTKYYQVPNMKPKDPPINKQPTTQVSKISLVSKINETIIIKNPKRHLHAPRKEKVQEQTKTKHRMFNRV